MLTTSEAAELLGSSRQHVVDLCERGDLPYIWSGRHRRIPRAELDRILGGALTRDQERSLWLHRAVAGRLAIDPAGTMAKARRNIDERQLPPQATASMEVDVAFFDDAFNDKSDLVDGAIGELSPFHETNGYYAQGVSVTTAKLPRGWRDRLTVIETDSSAPGRGLCLEAHDCVVAKLVAGREKDFAFAAALLDSGIVEPTLRAERLATGEDAHEVAISRANQWLAAY